MRKKFGIIADDLTGANDSGVQLKESGLETSVLFRLPEGDVQLEETIVIDTDSRALSKEEAYNETKEAAKFLKQNEYQHIYKKMDSTLRGYIGVELQAIKEVFNPVFLVVAPAYPAYGRTTESGVHKLHGVPVSETEIAQDPKHPVKVSRIDSIMERETKEKTAVLSIEAYKSNPFLLREKLEALKQEGIHYLICDAHKQEDLTEIVKAISNYTDEVVWAGSAGLAEVLPEVFGFSREQEAAIDIPVSPKVLAVCGSLSRTTQEQVNYALNQPGIASVKVDTERILTEAWEDEKKAMITACREAFAENQDVVLYLPSTPQIKEAVKRKAREQHLTAMEVAERISQALGDMTRELVEQVGDLRALVLTGGDTAKDVSKQLGAKGFRLTRQIEPGIPQGSLMGTDRLMEVVTKAGAFGSEKSIYRAIKALKGECE
ncbi:membrane protein [Thalassobacillus devorans]|uniref:Membrane protein n=1 Tax=Thalassobacillus devorans TaxID=279813 RepID=A0ABQ1NV87_9BACI|nr:four-carbon acid sugar kinase family protein [Thalassobacillus devorans]NIK28572.1 uncharacterized protein YgbK (DUF1537 family) [Thalassobacillus devorans]GGC85165.1 membrane protein [Thalassobacillus devorans]